MTKTITVNGKEITVFSRGIITYEDICEIAFPRNLTVTYHVKNQTGGTLLKDSPIFIENGMNFTCVNTGNA
jgi:hypothetical protein